MADDVLRDAQFGPGARLVGLTKGQFSLIDGVFWSLASRFAPSRADIDDYFQEARIAALEALPKYQGRADLATFLYRVALNRLLNIEAARRTRKRGGGRPDYPEPFEAAQSDAVADLIERLDIEAALAKLSNHERAVVAASCGPEPRSDVTLARELGVSLEEIGALRRIA